MNDIKSLNDLKGFSMKLTKCIVYLSPEFACGVNIKFEAPNAIVIVLRDKPEPHHLIRRTFGRDMRNHIDNNEIQFTKGSVD